MHVRVKAGCQLAHNGAVIDGGAEIDLAPALAFEVRHLVDEVLPTGETRPLGAGERGAADLEAALAAARPHERISILEAARAATAGDLAKIDRAIALERARLAGESKPAAKAAPAKAAAAAKAAPKDEASSGR